MCQTVSNLEHKCCIDQGLLLVVFIKASITISFVQSQTNQNCEAY